jgi:hypothetical protein
MYWSKDVNHIHLQLTRTRWQIKHVEVKKQLLIMQNNKSSWKTSRNVNNCVVSAVTTMVIGADIRAHDTKRKLR